MFLYLRNDLLKAKGAKSAHSSQGTQRDDHSYAARVEIGYDPDGSPKYRYFDTQQEYAAYLKGKDHSKGAKELESKVKKEHQDSTEKQKQGSKHHNLLSKEDAPVSKSIRLFVRI